MLDLLPASTCGFLQVNRELDSEDGAWLEESGAAGPPWRHYPFDILRFYSGQMDLVGSADKLVLVQPDLAGDEYVLLIDIEKKQGNSLFDEVETESHGNYAGFPLLEIADSGLFLTKLNAHTWFIAPRSSL
ncbi:MAG: hypothetical protein ACI9NT_002227 [Bacteroidia bacterium]